jgi:hypothetical protein
MPMVSKRLHFPTVLASHNATGDPVTAQFLMCRDHRNATPKLGCQLRHHFGVYGSTRPVSVTSAESQSCADSACLRLARLFRHHVGWRLGLHADFPSPAQRPSNQPAYK